FLQVASLLMADQRDRATVEAAEAGDDRGAVGPHAVAVELDPVLEEALDVVQRVRAILVPRELDRAPDVLVRRLRLHPLQLVLQPLELAGELGAAEQAEPPEPSQPLPQ